MIGLIILDGWGCSQSKKGNAIALANTPTWDALLASCPHAQIETHGEIVGLPNGQMGNSEVGHLNIGAGRTVFQNFTLINKAIENGQFFDNKVFHDGIEKAILTDKAMHVIGLWSAGGVHSHQEHIYAFLKLAHSRGLKKIYLHLITDGRDCSPRSALDNLSQLEQVVEETGTIVATLIGRYYAMDRDSRWERVEKAYELLVNNKANFRTDSLKEAIQAAYARGESDEFIQSVLIKEGRIEDGDVVVMMNFRSDRARQLTNALNDIEFSGFERTKVPLISKFITLTQYHQDYSYPIAFPPQKLENGLGVVLSKAGKKQYRSAETEKYPHVTFFFNGGVDDPLRGEERCLIASPKVSTYDLQPEMSLPLVTQALCSAIESDNHDFFIVNFANPDMVGHSGILSATIKAVEACDDALSKIIPLIQSTGSELIICADHGNAECQIDIETGNPHTAHTTNLVPFLYVGARDFTIRDGGNLTDIAPTLLYLAGLEKPIEMTGNNLLLAK